MTDQWQGRPYSVGSMDIAGSEQRTAIVGMAYRAAVAVRTDPALLKLLGERLAADLGDLLAACGPGLRSGQLAALEALSRSVLAASSTPPDCPDHQLIQHRDHRPPWCRACGRDRYGIVRLEQAP